MLTTLQARLRQGTGRSWFTMRAQAETESAEILLYDYIGWGGVTAADFAKEVQALTAKTINVRLNTPGGDVFDGLAIYNSLKSHGATIDMRIDGIAASIGSIIAMAGDTITMGESTFLMIHNPWGVAIGNAADMRTMADTLEKVGGSLAGIYQARAKVTHDQAKSWMDEETWFTADEAKAVGLADVVLASESADATAQNRFDLSDYLHVPEALHASRNQIVVPDTRSDTAMRMQKRLRLVQAGEQSR